MSTVLGTLAKWAIPVGLSVSGAQAAMYDGVKPVAVGEGTHFLVLWIQLAVLFNVRTKPRNISTTTGFKDIQMVSLTLRVLHRPEIKNLSQTYQNLGQDYDERVIPSIGNEVLNPLLLNLILLN
ncbi:unnamed protein product [Rhizopus stolonifer]